MRKFVFKVLVQLAQVINMVVQVREILAVVGYREVVQESYFGFHA